MSKNIVNLFDEELDKMDKAKTKEIEKYKKREQKKENKKLKRLEKQEDRGFAKMQKVAHLKQLYEDNKHIIKNNLPIIYKVSILLLIILEIIYFIVSFFRGKLSPINNILFLFIISGFLLTSTIQKKNARKFISIITCFIIILWIILNI